MKKVHGYTTLLITSTIFFSICFLGGPIFLWAQFRQVPILTDLFSVIIGGAFFLYFVRTLLAPLWIYDANSFSKVNLTGSVIETHSWAEVTKILFDTTLRAPVKYYTVYIGDRVLLKIGPSITKDYLKILSDVVRFVQNGNSSAKIDPVILNKVENHL